MLSDTKFIFNMFEDDDKQIYLPFEMEKVWIWISYALVVYHW